MAVQPLPGDSTITSIQHKLGDPIEYVRVIVGQLAKCNQRYGNAHVRIGVT